MTSRRGRHGRRRAFWRGLAAIFGASLIALAVAVGFNALRARSHQIAVAPRPVRDFDVAAAAGRLAEAVRLRTVSFETPDEGSHRQLTALRAYLEKSFPRTHAALRREIVNDYTLVFSWPGAQVSAAPIVLMAHQDVVPVAPGSEAQWHAGPFSGAIQDGFIWGRGAWDDKASLMAIFEAVESLLATGFHPQRTVYLVFGHDEENGGGEGAKAVAELFRQRNVHPEFVLDEGLVVADGIVPGLAPPVALIGIAEKGWATLKLTATAVPGHSSMPGPRTSIGALAAALEKLDRRPFPAAVSGVAAQLFATIAPEMHGLSKVALTNLWLTEPLVRWQLTQSPSTNAMLRTTTAITVIRGGNKENVLPASAEALVNCRLLPGDTVAEVVDHVARAIHDPSIRIDVLPGASEASPVSAADSAAYRLIERAIRGLMPGVLVAPGLVIGGTDSHHMDGVADNVYRFTPVRVRPEDLARFHGTDERIAIDNYGELMRFYAALLEDAASRP